MSLHTLLLVALATTSSICPTFSQDSPRTAPSVFKKFWDIGCEFSGVVTRVRRSVDNPPTPEPNFENPEELFEYLYPLADVDPDAEGSQRSAGSGTHSLSSWLEDLMELWHSECHSHQRERRSAEGRASTSRRDQSATRSRRKQYNWRSKNRQPNSTLATSMRRQAYDGYDEDEDYTGVEHRDKEEDGILIDDGELIMDDEDDENCEKDKFGKCKCKEKDKFGKCKDKDKLNQIISGAVSTVAGLIPEKPDKPAVASNVPTLSENKEEDIFFQQYGGDIEYFFPLLSFGIPFDGEITLLGFHGFRGIFPY